MEKSSDDPKARAPVSRHRSWTVATFAGGCFWCLEADFEKVPGVQKVVSGYTGGQGKNPTYEDYAQKGHIEAIQVFYHSQVVAYQQLLDYFWRHVNPTDAGGQFADRGRNTVPPSFTTTRSRSAGPRIRRQPWPLPAVSRNPSSRRSCRPLPFIPQKNTTRVMPGSIR